MSPLLVRSSIRHMASHRWQSLLSVLGVAVGVAVVFSIDLVNQSAQTAFRLSTDAVAGRATHQIIAGPLGIDESLYTRLRVQRGWREIAPVVEGFVGVDAIPGRALHFIGVDPFAERVFRRNLQAEDAFEGATPGSFFTTQGAVYLPAELCRELAIEPGDALELRTAKGRRQIQVVGTFSDAAARGLSNVILADIATAQEILGSVGRLSRIDVIAEPGSKGQSLLDELRAELPSGVELARSDSRTGQVEQMTFAFTQNLLALSLLALVVGMFLIYNALTFSVVQRRGWIGDLRTLGVSGLEIYQLVLSEAALVGLLGTLLGLAGGRVLATQLLGMVTQTINDLYFVLSVQQLDMSTASLLKSAALGMVATLLAAASPAYEATRTPPRFAQNRSTLESRAHRMLPLLSVAGAALLLVGAALLRVQVRGVFFAFAALFPLIAGFALLAPGFLVLVLGHLPSPFAGSIGWLGRLAMRGILSQLSRSGVAIAALAIAVGTTVGVTTMIGSFRQSVVDWLDLALDSDVYVSRPYLVASRNDSVLPSELVSRLTNLDGVRGANLLRSLRTETQHGSANLIALDLMPGGETKYRYLEGDAESAWPRVRSGEAVLVSEPYAYRYGVSLEDSVVFMTTGGRHAFIVAGVYADYASELGTVMMHLESYRSHWHDDSLSGLGLVLSEGISTGAVVHQIHDQISDSDEISIQTPRELRQSSMEIFDRTFAITHVLRMLTVVVAFIGVFSALMAIQFERGRELGVLRALGLTPAQLWRLVTLQTGLMGFVSGLLALPFGSMLALVLVLVVNKRSFGWTLQMHWDPMVFVQAMGVAVGAALLAGLYPAYRMSLTSPARALHEE